MQVANILKKCNNIDFKSIPCKILELMFRAANIVYSYENSISRITSELKLDPIGMSVSIATVHSRTDLGDHTN